MWLSQLSLHQISKEEEDRRSNTNQGKTEWQTDQHCHPLHGRETRSISPGTTSQNTSEPPSFRQKGRISQTQAKRRCRLCSIATFTEQDSPAPHISNWRSKVTLLRRSVFWMKKTDDLKEAIFVYIITKCQPPTWCSAEVPFQAPQLPVTSSGKDLRFFYTLGHVMIGNGSTILLRDWRSLLDESWNFFESFKEFQLLSFLVSITHIDILTHNTRLWTEPEYPRNPEYPERNPTGRTCKSEYEHKAFPLWGGNAAHSFPVPM